MPKTNYTKALDEAYSLYIRYRDANADGTIRCISCGRVLPFCQFDCGHYFSRYHLSTRWDEHNCNAECIRCNRMDSSHLEGYRRNLIAKIGEEAFADLEQRHRQVGEMPSEEEFRTLISGYRDLARKLKRYKGL